MRYIIDTQAFIWYATGDKRNGYDILPLELSHVFQLAQLPLFHKDPFDRIMIAQAIIENIPIISIDPYFQSYPVTVIW